MPCDGLTKNYFFTTSFHFFMNALKRNSEIEVSYFQSEQTFDVMKLENFFDSQDKSIFVSNQDLSRGDIILNCDGMHYSEKSNKT